MENLCYCTRAKRLTIEEWRDEKNKCVIWFHVTYYVRHICRRKRDHVLRREFPEKLRGYFVINIYG